MKKSIIVALGFLLAFSPAFAQYDGAPMEKYQAKKEVKKEVRRDKYPHSDNVWENFDVLHINRLPSAATFLGYPSREMALKGEKEATPYYASLNGTWKFKYVPKVADRADIKVPGNWELQGFGYPFYVGSGYGFKRNPPLIPADNSPIGSYKRNFTVPASWKGRQIVLHFGSVASSFFVWVNGKQVGYSQDSKTPAEFDITDFLKIGGENEIAVQVFKFSDGYYLEDQDFWRFAGIQRDVYMYARPMTHIRDFEVVTDLDDLYTDADFSLYLELGNPNLKKLKGAEVELNLLDKAGKSIYTERQRQQYRFP